MNCKVVSPQKTMRYKNVLSVTLPAYSGQLQLLPGHAEAFILLKKGNITLRQQRAQKEILQILGGECYVKDNSVTVIL